MQNLMTDQQYYSTTTNYGSYQYVPLDDIVNNFMLMYVGDEDWLGITWINTRLFSIPKQGIKNSITMQRGEQRTVEFEDR